MIRTGPYTIASYAKSLLDLMSEETHINSDPYQAAEGIFERLEENDLFKIVRRFKVVGEEHGIDLRRYLSEGPENL